MTEKCLVCGQDARYIRMTQFAGEHPYCSAHARKEDDFEEDDSYSYWVKIVTAGSEQMSDKGYETSTHEEQEEFERNRNGKTL